MQHMTNQRLKLRTWSVLGLAALLVACEAPPPRRTVVAAEPVSAPIVVYPAQGQTPDQLERDRYECHVWAVQQTGFDPSAPGVAPAQRVVVQPANPPGSGTAVGAIAGAILGAGTGWLATTTRRGGGASQATSNAHNPRIDQVRSLSR